MWLLATSCKTANRSAIEVGTGDHENYRAERDDKTFKTTSHLLKTDIAQEWLVVFVVHKKRSPRAATNSQGHDPKTSILDME